MLLTPSYMAVSVSKLLKHSSITGLYWNLQSVNYSAFKPEATSLDLQRVWFKISSFVT